MNDSVQALVGLAIRLVQLDLGRTPISLLAIALRIEQHDGISAGIVLLLLVGQPAGRKREREAVAAHGFAFARVRLPDLGQIGRHAAGDEPHDVAMLVGRDPECLADAEDELVALEGAGRNGDRFFSSHFQTQRNHAAAQRRDDRDRRLVADFQRQSAKQLAGLVRCRTPAA